MECTGLPDSGYLPFRDRLYRKALRSRVPLAGSIEVTASCNLRCRHCYVAGEAGRYDEMCTEELLGLIDQLADAGCLWLLITGGEPLMRSDFEAFYTKDPAFARVWSGYQEINSCVPSIRAFKLTEGA